MTEKFVASNGIPVIEKDWGLSFTQGVDLGTLTGVSEDQANALREFFQHERDRELGRWRWPENAAIVVWESRRSNEKEVTVLDEGTGYVGYFSRGHVADVVLNEGALRRAARAYFAAHPEPKPWHDAKPGEVWVVKISTGPTFDEVALQVREYFTEGFVFKDHIEDIQYPLTDPAIITARRIWPEAPNV